MCGVCGVCVFELKQLEKMIALVVQIYQQINILTQQNPGQVFAWNFVAGTLFTTR